MNSSTYRILVITLLVGCTFLNFSTFAQKKDSIRIDSVAKLVEKVVIDTLKNAKIAKKKADFHFFQDVFLPIDSTKKRKLPKIALYRSLILPGWGQATNRQYWLMPIIYAGAVGAVRFDPLNIGFWYFNSQYKQWYNYLETAAASSTGKATVVINNVNVEYSAEQIASIANVYNRYKTLSIMALGVGWILQAIQANVQAHLNTFDMNDNLSLRFEPSIQPTLFGSAAVGGSLKLYLK